MSNKPPTLHAEPWTSEQDVVLLSFVPPNRSSFVFHASVIVRRMSARFPERRFTKSSVLGRLRRIMEKRRNEPA
jgi:hypothetical protein